MTIAPNLTHRVDLDSWVASANRPDTDFPIQNLPFGVFRTKGVAGGGRIGVAIGDQILDLAALLASDVFADASTELVNACAASTLNALMALDPALLAGLRVKLSTTLAAADERGEATVPRPTLLVPMADVEMVLPVAIGDYTDFYASIHHATNMGSMFRPDNPLLPNYKYVPIGYHGRGSTIVISGTPVRRPRGQLRAPDAPAPTFGPSKALDYEMEAGIFVGQGNRMGQPIPIGHAAEHLFGLCLVNDWSARDIQAWEYQPLGPFLAKSFTTTLSPWVVTLEALAPFRSPAFARAAGDPAPLPYLLDQADQTAGGIDLQLEVYLLSAQMRAAQMEPLRLSRGNFTGMYWTIAQLLTHHASNGCELRSGDLLASGTVSGPTHDSRGSLQELTWRGAEPLTLPSGETRRFLEDGDEVIMRGTCERPGTRRIGFGECRGVILPALNEAS